MRLTEMRSPLAEAPKKQKFKLNDHIQSIRNMGNLVFFDLRRRSGVLQVVVDNSALLAEVKQLSPETPVAIEGESMPKLNEPGQMEIRLLKLTALSNVAETLPIEIGKQSKIDSLILSTMFDYRPLTLRNPKMRAIFKIEAAICTAFRELLSVEGFTEIHSPKIVSTGTEGGAQLFEVNYFGRQAFLAQSPQFYKQILVGVFERVLEVGPVFRAEPHDTTRHLNEFVSMDLEMGFIEDEQDVISTQIRVLRYIFAALNERCSQELQMHGAFVPQFETIPQITFEDALTLLERLRPEQRLRIAEHSDLDSEDERLLGEYFTETEGSDLVYITKYPIASRPFYTKPYGPMLSRSFDLLFRGIEISTGGQRIHSHSELVNAINRRELNPTNFEDYLQCFRYGMPPHGGFAIGLERLTKQLLGLPTVKLATLFPRDMNRLTP